MEKRKSMEQIDLYSELAKIEVELDRLMKAQPELEEIYCSVMGEQPGEIVYLPRIPTAEDVARAKALMRERDERGFSKTH